MSPGMQVQVDPGMAIGPSFDRLVPAAGAVGPLFAVMTPAVSIIIQAHPNNNAEDIIWVGPAQLGDGIGGVALAAGESVVINIRDASLIYIQGNTATDRAVGFVVR